MRPRRPLEEEKADFTCLLAARRGAGLRHRGPPRRPHRASRWGSPNSISARRRPSPSLRASSTGAPGPQPPIRRDTTGGLLARSRAPHQAPPRWPPHAPARDRGRLPRPPRQTLQPWRPKPRHGAARRQCPRPPPGFRQRDHRRADLVFLAHGYSPSMAATSRSVRVSRSEQASHIRAGRRCKESQGTTGIKPRPDRPPPAQGRLAVSARTASNGELSGCVRPSRAGTPPTASRTSSM